MVATGALLVISGLFKGYFAVDTGRAALMDENYYFWSIKRNGKLTSISLAVGDLPKFRRWIENRRQLEILLEEVLEHGVKQALKEKKSGSVNETNKKK